MYGYNGKSVGYFSSFREFYFGTKWLVYASIVTVTCCTCTYMSINVHVYKHELTNWWIMTENLR